MIPHKLTMQGFGSYLQKTVIDFDRVDGIFLIDGSTGAGKSLILDAMTYALYGRSSGERTGLMSRCLHGKDRVMTVEFVFEAAGKMYEFCRYDRYRKQKGSTDNEDTGDLVRKATAFDITDGRTQLNSKDTFTDVNLLAEELLHMSYEQFCQIVVLPQGKIEKLLTSGSGEKEQLFTELFGTEKLTEITDRLMENCNAEDKKLEAVRVGLARFYSPDFETIEALREELSALESGHAESGKALEKAAAEAAEAERLEKEANELFAKFQKLYEDEQKLSELKNRADEFAEKKAYLEDIEAQKNVLPEYKAYKSGEAALEARKTKLESAKQDIITAEKSYTTAEKQAEEHKKDSVRAEKARSEYNELIRLEEVYGRVAELTEKGTAARNEHTAAKARLEKYSRKRSELKEAAEKLEAESQKFSGINFSEKITVLMEKLSRLENGRRSADMLSALSAKDKTDRDQLSVYEEKCSAAENFAEDLQAEYDRCFGIHLKGIASELAAELSEGKRCPVCGSIHHPEPAEETVGHISREQLEKLKNEADRARSNANVLAHSRDVLKITADKNAEDMEKLREDIKSCGYTAEEYAHISEEIASLKKTEKECGDIRSRLSALRSELSEAESGYEKSSAEERDANDKLNELLSEYRLLKISMREGIADAAALKKAADAEKAVFEAYDMLTDSLEKDLKSSAERLTAAKVNLANAENEFFDAEKKYSELRSTLEQKLSDENITMGAERFIPDEKGIAAVDGLRRICSEYDANVKNLTAETAVQRELLLEKTCPDMAEYEKRKSEKAEEYSRLNVIYEKESDRISRLKKASDDYNTESAAYDKAIETASRHRDFCEKMAGRKAGTTRMSFPRYVLGIMLDNVLAQANVMLERVLDSNYRLYKDNEAAGNTKAGLDINVINRSVDSSGAKYSVKMLSGGEKFVMSVILGLAIASSVRNRNGGIEVNSLFIDEGFGTLDDDALKEILEVLAVFGSGKKIGIISHVSSLSSLPTGFEITRVVGGGSIVKTRASNGK